MKSFITYMTSPVGAICLRSTEEYIVSIKFVEQEGKEYDGAPLLLHCKNQLNEYFDGQRKEFDFPIRQAGSAFQQNVWEYLQHISFGKTMSYMQLAKQIGDVKAIRAIAAANGKNSLAIVVPCHRVIGSNGTLVGYAGGLWRKKWLLEHEAKLYSGVQQLSLI